MIDKKIQRDFDNLDADLNYLYTNLKQPENLEFVSFERLSQTVVRYISQMDIIVSQIQKKTEDDIKSLIIVELELDAFSILVILMKMLFIMNPATKKISTQNKKLKEISCHPSHAINSHIKNSNDLRHVIKIEKNMAHKQELNDRVMNELDDLEQVSKNMVNTLEATN